MHTTYTHAYTYTHVYIPSLLLALPFPVGCYNYKALTMCWALNMDFTACRSAGQSVPVVYRLLLMGILPEKQKIDCDAHPGGKVPEPDDTQFNV